MWCDPLSYVCRKWTLLNDAMDIVTLICNFQQVLQRYFHIIFFREPEAIEIRSTCGILNKDSCMFIIIKYIVYFYIIIMISINITYNNIINVIFYLLFENFIYLQHILHSYSHTTSLPSNSSQISTLYPMPCLLAFPFLD